MRTLTSNFSIHPLGVLFHLKNLHMLIPVCFLRRFSQVGSHAQGRAETLNYNNFRKILILYMVFDLKEKHQIKL